MAGSRSVLPVFLTACVARYSAGRSRRPRARVRSHRSAPVKRRWAHPIRIVPIPIAPAWAAPEWAVLGWVLEWAVLGWVLAWSPLALAAHSWVRPPLRRPA